MRTTLKMLFTLAVLVLTPLLLSTVFASAQSFNCAKAQSSAEFAICNNEDLLGLDEELAVLFIQSKAKLHTRPQRQTIARAHNQWMVKRDHCALDWACLTIRYQERISELDAKS